MAHGAIPKEVEQEKVARIVAVGVDQFHGQNHQMMMTNDA